MEKVNHIENIVNNYSNWEKEMVVQLTYEWGHGSTIGSNREEVWKSLFERIVPRKFCIGRGVFIIDSKGKCSKEVDLAIYDEQYTPYIFNYGTLKFIPIEAVAAVIECKSNSIKKTDLKNWLAKLNDLQTSQESTVRIAGRIAHGEDKVGDLASPYINTQTATRPITILCYIGEEKGEKKSNNRNDDKWFDITIKAQRGKDNLQIQFNEKNQNLLQWYLDLNHSSKQREIINKEIKEVEKSKKYDLEKAKSFASVVMMDKMYLNNKTNSNSGESSNYAVLDKEKNKISLLSFIFEFNQLLMLINNPIFFPHRAYVERFNIYLGSSGSVGTEEVGNPSTRKSKTENKNTTKTKTKRK